jgi:pimeloyl-ACP methyl ester carboxylesterase
VLVVAGADDGRYPAAEAEAAARQMPSAKFVPVESSAHLTPLEHPELSARLIRDLVPPR